MRIVTAQPAAYSSKAGLFQQIHKGDHVLWKTSDYSTVPSGTGDISTNGILEKGR